MGNSRKLEGCQLYFQYFKKIKGMSRGTDGWFCLTSVQGKIVEQLFQNLSKENLEAKGTDNSSNSRRESLSKKKPTGFHCSVRIASLCDKGSGWFAFRRPE